MSVAVTYKGNQIASFTDTTKTLKTSGKYMEDDVTISESGVGGGVDLPVFTVEYDSNYDIVSATCSYTYAECVAAYNDGKPGAYCVIRNDVDTPNPWEAEFAIAANASDSTKIEYIGFYRSLPGFDVIYHSNGQVEVTDPSSHALSLNATQNGTYWPNDGVYVDVTVNVPSSSPTLQAKTNVSPSTSSQTITADSGYDGLSSVQINAMPSMTLPTAATSSSSGTSQGTITPTSSAQYLNIPTGYNSAAAYYTIAAASGGASNIVTGTFTGTTTGAAMDVTLNYSGSGYPIAAVIYPSGGVAGNSTYSALVQRYATAMFGVTKATVNSAPTYASTRSVDEYIVVNRYKSSTSTATSYSQAGGQTYITTGSNPTATNTNVMNFKSKTKMSVYIASSSYGFAANVEYTYYIIYSS